MKSVTIYCQIKRETPGSIYIVPFKDKKSLDRSKNQIITSVPNKISKKKLLPGTDLKKGKIVVPQYIATQNCLWNFTHNTGETNEQLEGTQGTSTTSQEGIQISQKGTTPTGTPGEEEAGEFSSTAQ